MYHVQIPALLYIYEWVIVLDVVVAGVGIPGCGGLFVFAV